VTPPAEWAAQIRAGDLRALARAATAVENRQIRGEDLLKELFPFTGKAAVLGITGSPGAGKSTLVDHFASALRAEGQQVGVIAVDPSSPYSGGAILGDRIRMQRHHADPGIFIRSMATRGSLGGLARTTIDMTLLLDGAGRDTVLVETVGVGQDEVEIAKLADVTVVVLVPNMGDDVQAIKAGIMEIADVFVINKSDQPGADRLDREIKAMQSLSTRKDGWVPPLVWTVASENKGIDKALEAIRTYQERGRRQGRAVETWTLRLRDMVRDRLMERIEKVDLEEAARRVERRETDPYTVVDEWVRKFNASVK
jgi:LAO/AO transport system kinase